MGKLHQYNIREEFKEFLTDENTKTTVAVLAVELVLQLFVTYKGMGRLYLPITFMLMCFTAICCGIAFRFKADRYLLISVLVLLNLGFVVQALQVGNELKVDTFLWKFMVCILGMGVGAVYKIWGKFLKGERGLKLMMAVQIAICLLMVTGGQEKYGAKINFLGMTIFEVVKIMYLFVAVSLLCKPEEEKFSLLKLHISREVLLIVYTGFLSVSFILCKELGTLMVVLFTCASLLWIYGKNKTLNTILIVFSVITFLAVWVVCDQVLYPKLMAEELVLPGKIAQLVNRFGAALNPERYYATAGYQGTLGLEAIAMGGILGIQTERYRLLLPEAGNDFIFANLVQTCGLLMGVIVLVLFFIVMCRGVKIATNCKDPYYQGIAMSVTTMIITETLVHIGYNLALFPITGIPCYFFSQGFSATATGMMIVSVVLAISTGTIERSAE